MKKEMLLSIKGRYSDIEWSVPFVITCLLDPHLKDTYLLFTYLLFISIINTQLISNLIE